MNLFITHPTSKSPNPSFKHQIAFLVSYPQIHVRDRPTNNPPRAFSSLCHSVPILTGEKGATAYRIVIQSN